MRQRSGCKACRERHIKCVKLRDSEKCKYCTERKRPCIRGNAFRFRPVTAVKFNAGEDIGSAEQSLEFRGNQTWVHIPNSLRFVPPNTEGDEDPQEAQAEAEAEADSGSASAGSGESLPPAQPEKQAVFGQDANAIDDTLFAFPERSSFSSLHRTDSHGSHEPPSIIDSSTDLPLLPPIHDVLNNTNHVSPHHNSIHGTPPGGYDSNDSSQINHSASLLSDSLSWARTSTSNPGAAHSPIVKKSPNNTISPFSSTAFSPSSSLTLRWPVSSAYEARLFHHYLIHCTNWIDVCDSRRHFEKEVPKRAAHFPVILNGILGLSARHLWLMGKVDEDLSQPYVDQCLQALIVALEDPLAHWDENFLVAVILLRLHEEMGDSDEQCHHFGTARILNSISSFAADGGLRESASWVSLRQHIYVSLTTQQPLNLSLDNYKHSGVFREFDDEAWANRIIFLFATILHEVFGSHEPDNVTGISKERWNDLDSEVEEWERTKPWSFCALHIEPNAGNSFTGAWPDLRCAQGVVAVGLQYYHLCRILLTVYSPHASLVGLAGIRARKATDAQIRKHIRITIGYGVSNSHCGNAMFQGSHILSACGAYIVDRREQEMCVEYLKGVQSINGWRTDKVLADLKEQWVG